MKILKLTDFLPVYLMVLSFIEDQNKFVCF